MTTETPQVDERRVELRHTTTTGQFREAMRGHAKVSAAVRRQRVVVVVAAVLMAVMAVHTTPDEMYLDSVGAFFAVAFLLFGLVGLPWMTSRAQQRIHADRGEREITVEDSGVSVRTEHTLVRYGWGAMSRYVETRHLFVLVSADKRASCLVFLPKQGPDGTDESERLREIIGARLPAGRAARP
ncbi:YcxB family protein [Streptomyces sp. MS06]|uniref:YcxB family protein n=1 Tax=Streptomyces sp. MS06 TaxID=3385974 RepID=UPI0039A289F6